MYIERELEKTILKYMDSKEIIAVVGARQCGKTTLIGNILDSIEKKGKKISRISFDDSRIIDDFDKDIENFLKKYVDGFDILFIDEVQYSKNSGQKLKYIYDSRKNLKIIISGSSAPDISIHSLKYLVGRIFIFVLYPFSFYEYLLFKNKRLAKIYVDGDYGAPTLKELNNLMIEFITFGGYPNVVLSEDDEQKKLVLNNIYNTYLLKEIKEILTLSKNHEINNLVKALSLQIGNLVNYNELSTITNCNFREIKNYLSILDETYICKLIIPYSSNLRTELVKNPKIYFFDIGFRNTAINNFLAERVDLGSIFENFIFSELIKHKYEVKFWRTKSGAEVDFIIEINQVIIPIEVKTTLNNDNIGKSMHSFIDKYNPKFVIICSLNYESTITIKETKVLFIPHIKLINKLKNYLNQR